MHLAFSGLLRLISGRQDGVELPPILQEILRQACGPFCRLQSKIYQAKARQKLQKRFPRKTFSAKNEKKPWNRCDSKVFHAWRGREDLNLRDAFYTSYSLSRGAPSASWVLPQVDGNFFNWRREWDSNPRMLSHRRFSRPVPSTARPSLRIMSSSLLPNAGIILPHPVGVCQPELHSF